MSPGLYLQLLHVPSNLPFVPLPFESHRIFGASFLLLGTILLAEALAGRVWYRNRLRMLIFPATLVLLGQGMIAVTFLESAARLAHFGMGLPMTIGGWAEARHRLGEVSRGYVDVFLVPALVFAGIETLLYHVSSPVLTPVPMLHASLAFTAFLVAGLRLYQARDVQSMARSLLIAGAVLLIGFELYLDAFFQR